jgi:hypothetical protein
MLNFCTLIGVILRDLPLRWLHVFNAFFNVFFVWSDCL